MKSIFFITGVNGVGKTTVIEPLRKLLPPSFELHDFDERGVPDNVGRKWRIDETQHWIKLGDDNIKNNVVTIICGFARPSEIVSNSAVGFVLLDADEETIKKRLMNRYQTSGSVETIERVSGKSVEQFISDNVNFASTIRDEAKQYGVDIVDTKNLTPDEVAREVFTKLQQLQQ